MKIKSGKPFYGQEIGVLVFSTKTQRIPGDAGHAESFTYPVRYEVIDGRFTDLIEGNNQIKANIMDGCTRLEELGIRGIVGDCGLMSLYQEEIGAQIGVPFIGSSLCQIPMIWQMIGRQGRIGILTGHSDLLSEKHLKASGWTEEIKISIQGMQDESHFNEIVIQGGNYLDVCKMKEDVLHAVKILKEKTPDLKAIVLECSNLATYSRDISEEFEIPVFDTMSAVNLLSYAVMPPRYIKD